MRLAATSKYFSSQALLNINKWQRKKKKIKNNILCMDREENCNKNLSCLNMALKRSSQIQRMPSPYQKPEMFCKIWKSKTNTRKCQYKHITTIKFHNVYRIEFCKKTKHSGLPWSVARKIWHINGYVAWN